MRRALVLGVLFCLGFLSCAGSPAAELPSDALDTADAAKWTVSDYTGTDFSQGRLILSSDSAYAVYRESCTRWETELSCTVNGGAAVLVWAAEDAVYPAGHILEPANPDRLEVVFDGDGIRAYFTDGREWELLWSGTGTLSAGNWTGSISEGTLRISGAETEIVFPVPAQFAGGGYPGFGTRGTAILRIGSYREDER